MKKAMQIIREQLLQEVENLLDEISVLPEEVFIPMGVKKNDLLKAARKARKAIEASLGEVKK